MTSIAELSAAPLDIELRGASYILWPLRECDIGSLQRWAQVEFNLPASAGFSDAAMQQGLMSRRGRTQLVFLSLRRQVPMDTIWRLMNDSFCQKRLIDAIIQLNQVRPLGSRLRLYVALAQQYGWTIAEISQLTLRQITLLLPGAPRRPTRKFSSRAEMERFRSGRKVDV